MLLQSQKVLATVETKPYFKEGNFVLYHGDSLNILNQLPPLHEIDF
jgi:hypothetical protein